MAVCAAPESLFCVFFSRTASASAGSAWVSWSRLAGDDVDLLGLAAAWCGHEHLAARVGVSDRVGGRVSVERHQVDLADFPNVKRWYETMMARPGVRRGFEVPLS